MTLTTDDTGKGWQVEAGALKDKGPHAAELEKGLEEEPPFIHSYSSIFLDRKSWKICLKICPLKEWAPLKTVSASESKKMRTFFQRKGAV